MVWNVFLFSAEYSFVWLPGSSLMKNLPAIQEMWVQSLGWKDPLEEGMATDASILTCRILWTE